MTERKTDKLYLEDSYVSSFTANVTSLDRAGDDALEITLDQSCFYPESGGQLSDSGTIGAARVVDVRESGPGGVVHRVEAGEEPSGVVECTIDWNRRFDHMQQHTGQHVLSRAFIETANLHTVSFHMGEEACTIDLEGAGFNDLAAREAEALANRVIEENRPVRVRTVPVAELDALDLRRKVPEGVTDARLVEVGDFDLIPCCGTHVNATGELAAIKVLKAERVKNKQRVHFLVGRRAVADYGDKHSVVQALAIRFTTGVAEVGAKVDKLIAENQSAKKRVKLVSQRLADFESSTLAESADTLSSGCCLVVHFDESADGAYLRMLSTRLCAHAGVVSILGAGDGTVLCAAAQNIDVDLATPASEMVKQAGGSGGGKGGFAQLKLPANADISEFLGKVEAHVRQVV